MRQKRTRADRRLPPRRDDRAPAGRPEPLADWVLRTETGWGMPHSWVAFLAAIVVVARALPWAAGRAAAAWRRARG